MAVIIRVCDLCEQELYQWRLSCCFECHSVYHVTCWREYERIHGHGCRVCCEREAEANDETKTMLAVLQLMADMTGDIRGVLVVIGERNSVITGNKTTGQLRRRSMDLTRKLAELRAGK